MAKAKKRSSSVKSEHSGSTKKIYVNVREVNWVVCLVMSILFGWFGVDRFIMGRVGTGILKLITLGGLGIWWLVDVILIATKYQFKNIEWD
jgi:TM2 domain-containing membrane protein YozV